MFTIEFDAATQAQVNSLVNSQLYIEHIEAVMEDFYAKARDVVLLHIHETLGHDDLKTLNPEYAARKRENPFLFHPPSPVDPDQPLIFTGTLYHSIDAEVTTDGVVVSINSIAAPSRAAYGFQFATPGKPALRRNYVPGQFKRKQVMTNAANVAEYAVKWEMETHFLEKGIQRAEDDLVKLLTDSLISGFNGILGGLVTSDLEIIGGTSLDKLNRVVSNTRRRYSSDPQFRSR